jgi:PPOX class probable F420-dependent enzyme
MAGDGVQVGSKSMSEGWIDGVRSLLEAPSAAVLTTYGQNGSPHVGPVWFRWIDGAFEVVIAQGDVKLRNLARDPRCGLLVFETVPPFRGVETSAEAELVAGDHTSVRASIAGRYLGGTAGVRFAETRTKPGVLVRIIPGDAPRVWDLSAVLPA